MSVPRYRHRATRLADGRVLVTGGIGRAGALADAEIYDPGADAWTQAPPMTQARLEHTATLLADGRVLVLGGERTAGLDVIASAEIFDPTSGTWTDAPRFNTPIRHHASVLLRDGRVLVVGGDNRTRGPVASCRLFDPRRAKWTNAPKLLRERSRPAACLLQDGRILVAGGQSTADSEVLDVEDPRAKWQPAGVLMAPRNESVAVSLPGDGTVLLGGDVQSSEIERWDPARSTWAVLGGARFAREAYRFVAAVDGTIVGVGAARPSAQLSVTERWNSSTGAFEELEPAPMPVTDAAVSPVGDQGILLSGGLILGYASDEAFSLQPAAAPARRSPVEIRLLTYPKPQIKEVIRFWKQWAAADSDARGLEQQLEDQWQRRPNSARELFDHAPAAQIRPEDLSRILTDAESVEAYLAIR